MSQLATVYYCIIDDGDGSASLKLFDSQEALDNFHECLETNYPHKRELSDGGGTITFDGTTFKRENYFPAMSLAQVALEYGSDEQD